MTLQLVQIGSDPFEVAALALQMNSRSASPASSQRFDELNRLPTRCPRP